jgi:hypothetical protein
MKRQLVVATSLALLVFAASPSFAVNGNIGIYADQGQAICAAPLGYQTPLTLYVYGLLQGGSVGGITGAEYQITQSANVDWIYGENFSPATGSGAITVGSGAIVGPSPGINIAWGGNDCQTGPGSVLLEIVTVFDATGNDAGTPNTLRVEAHTTPGNPFFRCPLFTLCDAPVFTKVCLGQDLDTIVCPFPPFAQACTRSTSGEFFINPVQGFNCTVAVAEKTWSQMKGLYNN